MAISAIKALAPLAPCPARSTGHAAARRTPSPPSRFQSGLKSVFRWDGRQTRRWPPSGAHHAGQRTEPERRRLLALELHPGPRRTQKKFGPAAAGLSNRGCPQVCKRLLKRLMRPLSCAPALQKIMQASIQLPLKDCRVLLFDTFTPPSAPPPAPAAARAELPRAPWRRQRSVRPG